MIRPYNSTDAEMVIAAWYAAATLAYDFVPQAFWQTEREDLEHKYLPHAETWVYEQEDKIVGFISLIESEIGGLFVSPAYQGQGIGTQLIHHARALRGRLTLDVFQQNVKSRRFYEKCGFAVTNDYRHEPTGCRMLTMQSE